MNQFKQWIQHLMGSPEQGHHELIVQWFVINLMTCVLMLVPAIEHKSLWAIALAYALVGVIVLNTMILGICSMMPAQVVEFKSKRVEKLAKILLQILGLGVPGAVVHLLSLVFRQLTEGVPMSSKVTRVPMTIAGGNKVAWIET
jgi:hypothetical protein